MFLSDALENIRNWDIIQLLSARNDILICPNSIIIGLIFYSFLAKADPNSLCFFLTLCCRLPATRTFFQKNTERFKF